MTVLMTGEADGLTPATYLQMFNALGNALKNAPGFVLHMGCPTDDGAIRVMEIWRSKEESDRFFAQFVAPNLPQDVRPKRRTLEIAALLVADDTRELG